LKVFHAAGTWSAVAALACVGAAAAAPEARFSLKETLRHEQLTVGQQGLTPTVERQTSARGSFSFSAELPLSGVDPKKLEPSTPFSVQAGSFAFSGTLGADPNYRVGRTSARVVKMDPTGSGKSRVTVLTGRLEWGSSRVRFSFQGKTPGAGPVAAGDFVQVEQDSGPFEGATSAVLEFAGVKQELPVALRGSLTRQEGREGLVSALAVVVELRGEGRSAPPEEPAPKEEKPGAPAPGTPGP
jgi:hypothetical protein